MDNEQQINVEPDVKPCKDCVHICYGYKEENFKDSCKLNLLKGNEVLKYANSQEAGERLCEKFEYETEDFY